MHDDTVELLQQLAVKLDLDKTKQTAVKVITAYLEEVHFHMSMKELQCIISLCLPIQRGTTDVQFSSASYPLLWEAFSSSIETHLKSLPWIKVDIVECEMFSHLVHSFFRIESLVQRYNLW